ncbi:hypothetical protein CDAR_165351 [Caerostris darwini]|uniref:Uncharacterized protein n=1 Tax=Caerostris darwini TaxID=1538125 RepID=A0AAV4NWX6_9ARAC|nr:hypothetical protein CDAR_165351 [Caerostris darwini]
MSHSSIRIDGPEGSYLRQSQNESIKMQAAGMVRFVVCQANGVGASQSEEGVEIYIFQNRCKFSLIRFSGMKGQDVSSGQKTGSKSREDPANIYLPNSTWGSRTGRELSVWPGCRTSRNTNICSSPEPRFDEMATYYMSGHTRTRRFGEGLSWEYATGCLNERGL